MDSSQTTDEMLSRRAASEYLRKRGFPVATATLATLATRGGGPAFNKFGPRVLYRPADLLEWAQARLSPPRHSSSQADLNDAKSE